VFRSCDLSVEALVELRPPADAVESRFPFAELDWARQWPVEEAWIVRKKGWSP
jgi:hypothetical protein